MQSRKQRRSSADRAYLFEVIAIHTAWSVQVRSEVRFGPVKPKSKETFGEKGTRRKPADGPLLTISDRPRNSSTALHAAEQTDSVRSPGSRRRERKGAGYPADGCPMNRDRPFCRSGKNMHPGQGRARAKRSGRMSENRRFGAEKRGMPRFLCHGRNSPPGLRSLRGLRHADIICKKAAGPAIRLPYYRSFMIYYRGFPSGGSPSFAYSGEPKGPSCLHGRK